MARNKTSKFGAAEGLFETQEQEALDVQNVHEVQEVQEEKTIKETKNVQQVQDVHEEMPATQGKKGAMTQFLNDIIATYREYNMELYKTHSKN